MLVKKLEVYLFFFQEHRTVQNLILLLPVIILKIRLQTSFKKKVGTGNTDWTCLFVVGVFVEQLMELVEEHCSLLCMHRLSLSFLSMNSNFISFILQETIAHVVLGF